MTKPLPIDATPQKRLFLSIIADYDFKTSLCELVDNALDHWNSSDRLSPLKIQVFMNQDRQQVTVKDTAGGVPRDQIQLLIAPGASREVVSDQMIGNFGVGGKRAGVAIGELVEVYTRVGEGQGHKFKIDNEWLQHEDWNMDIDETTEIEAGETKINISKLRQGFSHDDLRSIFSHLSDTYANFISNDCAIFFNGKPLEKNKFDNWAYPQEYPPLTGEVVFSPDDRNEISIRVTGGLISDRSPKEGNYGVHFYCNKRLILAHEKTYHVGFLSGYAGVPHPDASLCRVIVEMTGLPSLMPWNSSKSGINWSHPVFMEIRERIFSTAKRFSTISRRLKNERETAVFPFVTGAIKEFDFQRSQTGKEIINLPVPRGRAKKYSERIFDDNKELFAKKPWTRGIVEAIGVADFISRRPLSTKNRIVLLLLDSTFEISLKEFLVHQNSKYYPDEEIAKIFKSRKKVLDEVKLLVNLRQSDLDLAYHYANLRNKLVHERATVDILDEDVQIYWQVVERVVKKLFKVKL